MNKQKLIGKVCNRPKKASSFRLELGDGSKVSLIYPFDYAPFQEGDVLSCYCTQQEEGLQFESIIDVVLGQDKNTFLSLVVRALPDAGFRGRASFILYDYLCDLLKEDSYKEYLTLSDLMSYFAEEFLSNQAPEIIGILCRARIVTNGIPKPILTGENAKKLLQWWSENYDMRRLYCLGLTFTEIDVTQMTPYKLYKRLKENPYTVPSIPLEKCAELDARLMRQRNKYDIIFGEFVRELYKNTTDRKWSCTPVGEAESHASFLLNRGNREILTREFRVVFEQVAVYKDDDEGQGTNEEFEEFVYLKEFYKASKIVYDFIYNRVQSAPYADLGDPLFFDDQLDEYQRSAVAMAMKENICIICGPAGSGKTRTLRSIIQNLELHECETIVTSFTGKAVIRAKQLNGIGDNAATIHRILYSSQFEEFDAMIFEESSMISTPLLAKLINKYGDKKFRAIFVGDPNQLPPIEWGSMFASMINSRSIPKVELKSIHRVVTKDGKEDGIIKNTTKLCSWPPNIEFIYERTDNFKVITGGVDEVFEYVQKVKDEGGSPQDVTILCAYKKNIVIINKISQHIWNSDKASQESPDGRLWRVGDRVMVTKNVYGGIDIFNGQEGSIVSVSPKGFVARFEEEIVQSISSNKTHQSENEAVKLVLIEEKEMDEKYKKLSFHKFVEVPFVLKKKKKAKRTLKIHGGDDDSESSLSSALFDLSFAMTIHKAQGSEWKKVVVITPHDAPTGGGFLNRNIYYSADTRASEELINIDGCMKTPVILGRLLPKRHDSMTNKLKHSLERLHDYVEKKIEEGFNGYCEGMDDCDFW